jgi:hypothetical protein
MEDLVEEQVDEGDGVEEAAAPGVLDLAAGVDDLGSVELLGRGVLEPAKDAKALSGIKLDIVVPLGTLMEWKARRSSPPFRPSTNSSVP